MKYPAISPPYERTCAGVAGGASVCIDSDFPPQPTAITIEIKLGIHVHRSHQWRALYPINEAAKLTRQVMTMPTVTLTLSGLRAAMVWPPTIVEIRVKPVTVAAFRRSGIVTRNKL